MSYLLHLLIQRCPCSPRFLNSAVAVAAEVHRVAVVNCCLADVVVVVVPSARPPSRPFSRHENCSFTLVSAMQAPINAAILFSSH